MTRPDPWGRPDQRPTLGDHAVRRRGRGSGAGCCGGRGLTDVQDSHDDLEHAADERQRDGVGGVVVDDRVAELGRQQRHDGRRSEVHVLGRAEQTVDETRHVRRVQPVLARTQHHPAQHPHVAVRPNRFYQRSLFPQTIQQAAHFGYTYGEMTSHICGRNTIAIFVRQRRRTVRSLVVKICRVIRIKLNQLV